MSSTLLPFLYQTRTLQWPPRGVVSRSTLRALFSSTPTVRYDDKSGSLRRRPSRSAQAARPARPVRPAQAAQPTRPAQPDRPAQPARPSRTAIPFELPAHLQSYSPDLKTVRGTITPNERRAFDRIFEEIAARKAQKVNPQPGDTNASHTATKNAPQQLQPQFLILEDDIGLNRFPPSLQKRAQRAFKNLTPIGLGDKYSPGFAGRDGPSHFPPFVYEGIETSDEMPKETETNSAIAQNNTESERKLNRHEEAQRKEHSRRVLDQMCAAQSDFELWDVMEKEVFTMVERLGIGEETEEVGAQPSAPDEEGAERLTMKIHGLLYPFYLVTGLRMMGYGFSRASPLTLSILPRIKALGTMSHILGAETEFYNTLAEICWLRNGDLEAVLELLEEMNHTGLSFDKRTYELVQAIRTTLDNASQGALGPFAQALIALPEYEFGVRKQVQRWSNTISMQTGYEQVGFERTTKAGQSLP